MAIGGPTAGNKGLIEHYGPNGGGLGFNTQWGLALGYANSRKRMLQLSYERLQTGMIMEAYSRPSAEFAKHSLFYKLRSNSIQFSYNMFRPDRGSLSPYGSYLGAVLGAGFVSGDLQEWDFSLSSAPAPQTLIDERYNYLFAGLEFGNNQIFFDRVVFSLSGRFALPLAFYRLYDTTENSLGFKKPEVDYRTDMAGYNNYHFDRASLARMLGCNLFTFQISIGYLIF